MNNCRRIFLLSRRLPHLVGALSLTVLCLLSIASMSSDYGDADTSDPATAIPKGTEPLMDYWMRDTWITLGPDGIYYMTGTTSDPERVFSGQRHCWDWNDGIYLFRSDDMKNWSAMGRIWSLDSTVWQGQPHVFGPGERRPSVSLNGDTLDNFYRAVWAPELHYIKSRKCWYIVACMNDSQAGKGSFVLKSTTGRPEGPYENIADNSSGPLFGNIDGSLFEDEDGTVYFVGHNHFIARMKDDMSGLAEPLRRLSEEAYSPEPYIEGAFICKEGGKYHLVQAIWSHRVPGKGDTYSPQHDSNSTRYSYDCIVASADCVYGPYSRRYNTITGGGHNNLFKDKRGEWWATLFFNPRGAQAGEYRQTCRPGAVPMAFRNGKFMIDTTRTAIRDMKEK